MSHSVVANSVVKRIRGALLLEEKSPGILSTLKVLPADIKAVNATASLFIKSLLLGIDHSLQKKQNSVKFDDSIDIEDIEELPFEEALEYMQKRLPVSAEEYYKLSDKARFRAFTVARLTDGDLLKKAKSFLEKSIAEGGTLSEFLKKTDTELLGELGLAGKGGGWYWENVYRTNVQTAYNTGRAIGFENVKPLALELVGIGDSRQTELCRSLTQPPVRRPYGDEFWELYWPPLHFSCRTTVRAIYDPAELEEEPITNIPDGIEKHRAKGFGTYPIDSDTWWDELPSMKRRAVAYGIQSEIEKVRKIITNRQMANGMRRSIFIPLTEEEKQFVIKEAEAIGIDKKYLVFKENHATGYSDERNKIFIGSDIFPSNDKSTHNRDNLSVRAVLAHEYYGHKVNKGTKIPQGTWNDEFRASYQAAKNAPNLTQEDRYRLILDALDRAKEAGIIIEKNDFMKEILYGKSYD